MGALAPLAVVLAEHTSPTASERQLRVAALRRQLDGLDRRRVRRRPHLPFGVEPIDAHLPSGGLAVGALHEVSEGGAAFEYAALATLFTAGNRGSACRPRSAPCANPAVARRRRSAREAASRDAPRARQPGLASLSPAWTVTGRRGAAHAGVRPADQPAHACRGRAP